MARWTERAAADLLAIGDYIAQCAVDPQGDPAVAGALGLGASYTFAGSVYWNRMKELSLYETDQEAIRRRVRDERLESVFLP